MDITERGRQVAATALLIAAVGAGTAAPHDETRAADAAALPTKATPPTATEATAGVARSRMAASRSAVPRARRPAQVVVRKVLRRAAPWVSPMPGARVTSCFGPRWGRLHAGVDLAVSAGTPIHAVGAGRVIAAGSNYTGYGSSVLIDHGNGWLTHYAHMEHTAVHTGERVTPGETIGYEGATGHVTGPHLHFEVHRGHFQNPVEPTGWMRDRGVRLGCD